MNLLSYISEVLSVSEFFVWVLIGIQVINPAKDLFIYLFFPEKVSGTRMYSEEALRKKNKGVT